MTLLLDALNASRASGGQAFEGELAGAGELQDAEGFDQAKFDKDKPEYSKKILELKKNLMLEAWLKELERENTPNIDLNKYEKYYH